eukprot:45930_1
MMAVCSFMFTIILHFTFGDDIWYYPMNATSPSWSGIVSYSVKRFDSVCPSGKHYCYHITNPGYIEHTSPTNNPPFERVALSYNIKAIGIGDNEACKTTYSIDNGASWTIIQELRSNNEMKYTYPLINPSADIDNANELIIHLGFTGRSSHECYYNDVRLTGTPITDNPSKTPTDVSSSSTSSPPTNVPTQTPSNPPTSWTSLPTHEPTPAPTKRPSLSPTTFPTLSPTVNPTQTPITIHAPPTTGNPTSNPTDAPHTPGDPTRDNPTSYPTLTPTINPTSNAITVPPVLVASLYWICEYIDELWSYDDVSLSGYATLMNEAVLGAFRAVTGHSAVYNVDDVWSSQWPWTHAGIIDFNVCSIFNGMVVDEECPSNTKQKHGESQFKRSKYLAIATFRVVSDQSMIEYEKYATKSMTSDTFYKVFGKMMNNALNAEPGVGIRSRRRNLLQRDNGFDVVSVTITDALSIVNTRTGAEDLSGPNESGNTNMMILHIVGCVLGLGLIVTTVCLCTGTSSDNSKREKIGSEMQLEMNECVTDSDHEEHLAEARDDERFNANKRGTIVVADESDDDTDCSDSRVMHGLTLN